MSSLSQIGINSTQNGQLRDLGDVMDDVGAKWTSLTKNEKAYIATTMAGKISAHTFQIAGKSLESNKLQRN